MHAISNLSDEALGEPSTTEGSIAQLTLQRSIELVTKQSRLGLITVTILTAALGGLFVPAVGWSSYLVWAGLVVAGFCLRQVWFERLRRDPRQASGLQLTLITSVSAATGWLVVLSLPIFGPQLPRHDLVLLSGLMLAWIAAAVSLLGVTPVVYGVYLVVCLITVFAALLQFATTLDVGVLGFAMAMGGLMMFRVAKGIRALLDEAVIEGSRSQALATQLDDALAQQKTFFETRSRFLAAASHDLRQPVQALTLLVSVMRRTENEERRKQVLDEIGQANTSIESMFSGLLDMASIDAGNMSAHICPVQIEPLLRSVLAGYPQRCTQKGLHFSLRNGASHVVLADTLLLQRVLGNLLENAWKYTLTGGISLETSLDDQHLLVVISDSGIGMDEQELTTLYQAFVRGPSAQSLGVPGLGLGLAIARHMCELMGVQLEIVSTRGSGTTARLWLPLATASTNDLSREVLMPSLAGLHIVVLEDDGQARAAMVHWLQEAGATVTSAAHGPDLFLQLEHAPLPPPSLVVADLNLGFGRDSGATVIVQLRDRYPGLRALLVTGEADVGKAAAGDMVLTKPVSNEVLAKAMIAALGKGGST